MTDRYLSVEQVAETLGTSKRTVQRLVQQKLIKGFKVGRAWRFAQADLDEYIAAQRQKAEAQA